jgi:hypothetical protein
MQVPQSSFQVSGSSQQPSVAVGMLVIMMMMMIVEGCPGFSYR